jgi:cold shock CspA family protein
MIGRVSFSSPERGIALITPSGCSRDHDLIASTAWFFVAGLGEPVQGQVIEFDLGRTRDGSIEAVNVRNPQLLPPAERAQAGAVPPTAVPTTPSAAVNPEGR